MERRGEGVKEEGRLQMVPSILIDWMRRGPVCTISNSNDHLKQVSPNQGVSDWRDKGSHCGSESFWETGLDQWWSVPFKIMTMALFLLQHIG